MFKQCLAGFALAAVLVWPATAQDAVAVVAAASKAMGVDTLKTVQFSATGLDFALGQAPNPRSPWPKFIKKSYTRVDQFRDAGVAASSASACRARIRRAAAASSRSSANSRRARRSSSMPTRRGCSSSRSG